MKIKEIFSEFKEFVLEFIKVRVGIVGIIIILLFIILMIFEPLILPYKETNKRWRDIKYWEDNPVGVPPIWYNFFHKMKRPKTEFINDYKLSESEENGILFKEYSFNYNFKYDFSPENIIVHMDIEGLASIEILCKRPDGEILSLYKRTGIFENEHVRIPLENEIKNTIFEFVKSFESETNLQYVDIFQLKTMDVLFGQKKENITVKPEMLKGNYNMIIKCILKEDTKLENVRIVITGKVSGLLGTDNAKRDIFSGIIAGIKWALTIGLLTAIVSVFIGLFWGVTSAYFGGTIGNIMNRIYEFFINIPMLPILIGISAVFKINIWVLIILLCIFSWTGSVRTIMAISLQIKEEVFIEASKSLGANHWRIIFKHIMPLILPLTFANMAFAVPGAILSEAGLSLLGLGDPTIVTWGSILHDAQTGSAFINGLWWWIIPPGLIMSLLASSFVFVGWAMDKILHPKLRTR
ncbi:MAG: ABC transporter permease [Spirochaetes bacterium]|nr:ABC transporter permease [Spirochaetota bacterium]